MSTINDDQSESSVPEKIDSGLTAKTKPGKPRVVLSKGDARYWLVEGRLFKNHGAAEYCCRFTALKRREHFPLGSSNKKTAAAKAAEIYTFVQAQGWDDALERYKPGKPVPDEEITVGSFIEEVCRVSHARQQTLDAYTKAFRKIVSDIKDITLTRGVAAWREQVDAVYLSSISPAAVVAWKNRRLKAVEGQPLKKNKAIVTINSLIRNSKALFSKKKILPFLDDSLKLPSPLPFDGVPMEKPPSNRYVSKLDPYAILAAAREQLEQTQPETFKVITLALVCGLRRSEIDNLLWRSFDFPKSTLTVETTEYHQLKSEDSAGDIDLDEDTCTLFKNYRAQHPTSLFVIESKSQPRQQTGSRYYRCNATFKKALQWLRSNGVEDPKPLHTLRKEIGSIIASEQDIYAASRYLRHSDIRITAAIYADKKKAVTPKAFSGLLGNHEKTGNETANNNTPD